MSFFNLSSPTRPAKTVKSLLIFSCMLMFLTACAKSQTIITDVDEREANEIVVFLASKGIVASKESSSSTTTGGGGDTTPMFNISTNETTMTEALSYLNQNGFPKKKSVSLLDLFAKQGLMSSEKEETIRYQAGLAAQIASTIRKIDGVIDADVQLSFPEGEALPGEEVIKQKITASVYVKHQGIIDDPNSHLVTKIKRLVAGSVTGLDINDVAVISDKSRINDIQIDQTPDLISSQPKDFVSIWSIVMDKASVGKFRVLFFCIMTLMLFFALIFGWLAWKFYPIIQQKGFKELLRLSPVQIADLQEEEESDDEHDIDFEEDEE